MGGRHQPSRLAHLATNRDDYGSLKQQIDIKTPAKHRWPHQITWDGQSITPLAKSQVLWLDNRVAQAKPWLVFACLAVELLTTTAMGYLLLEGNGTTRQLLGLCYVSLAIILICIWQIQRLSQQRLGVSEGFFILEQSPTRRISLRPEEISYNAEHLSGGPASLVLSHGGFTYFDRCQVQQHVFPRLKTARKVGPWSMLRLLGSTRHPQITGPLWMMAAALPLMAWFLVEFVRQIS